jgi:histone acetyltransferase 1
LTDEDNQESGQSFTPPGKKVTEYTANGDRYGIWAANLSDPAAKRLLRNMQILVLLFIDGASMIELDDPDWTIQRWTVFFV